MESVRHEGFSNANLHGKVCEVPRTGVTNINGIKNIGFNTTGIPNSNGSLMKKKVVGKDNLPSVLYCWI